MDLLFKRYASPFLLLDHYIDSGRFLEFVNEFNGIQTEELMWDVWLHKIFDQSFDDYKQGVMEHAKNNVKPTKKQLETTIINSKSILDSFHPEE